MPIEIPEEKNYLFECWNCNEWVVKDIKTPNLRVYCEGCQQEYDNKYQKIKQEYVALKIEMMYERSLRILEKQEACLADYKEAAEAVLYFAREDTSKFQSAPEMIATMELIRNGIKVKPQYKIHRHVIDILIPSMKVGLEIDGYNHKFQVLKDSHRDIQLIEELGQGWEIVRIPTKYIESNVKQLVPAIKRLYKEKQEIRSKNNGFIPMNYSERDKAIQKKYEKEMKPFKYYKSL